MKGALGGGGIRRGGGHHQAMLSNNSDGWNRKSRPSDNRIKRKEAVVRFRS